MKSTPAALVTHTGQEVTTLATCWKLSRGDGVVMGFTDHVRPLVISGVTYEADTGHSPTAIATSALLDVDNLEVQACLSSDSLLDEDLIAGLWDFAQIEIFRVNYADLTMGAEQLRKGWIGEVRTGRSAFYAELRGMTQPLQQSVGRMYGAACDADLGDARCGVTLATYTVSGSVTAATSNRIFTDSARGEAAGYFTYGKMTWTSGLNDGLGMEVKAFAAGIVELQETMPYTIAVGDAYTMYAGCDKIKATCIAKFGNVINFRGFDMVPGADRMMSGT
jgi:uncharacterized phage protein (TIGR02218 family)